jgi:hypothetical protein
MLKVRWQDNPGTRMTAVAAEALIDAASVAVQEGMLIFKHEDGRTLLLLPQNRFIDAKEVFE